MTVQDSVTFDLHARNGLADSFLIVGSDGSLSVVVEDDFYSGNLSAVDAERLARAILERVQP